MKTFWQAALSNGEIAIEGSGKYENIEGQLSPFQRLLAFINDNKLTIQGLSIKTEDNHFFILPTINPKFGGEIPIGYKQFRKLIKNINLGPTTKPSQFLYNVIEAEYPDFYLQLYVSENGDCNSWTSIVKKSS